MQVLGIDLGTTNSVAAIENHVFAVSEEGRTILPSVVAFLPNGHTLVGETARRRRVIDGENTIYSSKRIIGRAWNDLLFTTFRESYPFTLVEDEDGRPLFETRSGRFSATQIASMVLSKVLEGVRSIPSEYEVNVTVPASFGSGQRVATTEAAELAGLRHVHLIAEPLATTYAYLSLPRSYGRVMVYDLGGGTFDCAVIDCAGDRPKMIAHSSDLLLGGDDIDQRLADWVARYILEKYNWDVTNYAEIQCCLLARCEEAKIELSTHEETVIEISQLDPESPAAGDGVTVTRSLLEELSDDLVHRSFITCDAVLSSSKTRAEEIDSVFLAGGTTLLPFIQEGVRGYFGRPGMLEFDPTEVVARGACLAPPESRIRHPRSLSKS
jgi:molecular chaperone DnaK